MATKLVWNADGTSELLDMTEQEVLDAATASALTRQKKLAKKAEVQRADTLKQSATFQGLATKLAGATEGQISTWVSNNVVADASVKNLLTGVLVLLSGTLRKGQLQ